MMTASGVLEDIRPADLFTDRNELVRPGQNYPSSLVKGSTGASEARILADQIFESAQRSRDAAIALAEGSPTATTLSALAQAHAVLGEAEAASEAALRALDACRAAAGTGVSIQSSARIALEVLLRFDRLDEAHEQAQDLPDTRSLALTRAMIADDLGLDEESLTAIEGHDGAIFDSYRGYVHANRGNFRDAIPFLRAALRDEPEDPDALANLSVSLWNLGSHRKAIAAAARATRSAPGRKDLSMQFMELLLATGQNDRVAAEIRELTEAKVIPDSGLLVMQARLHLAANEHARALTLLDRALRLAQKEGDGTSEATIAANLLAIRFDLGRITFDQFASGTAKLLARHPENDVVVINFARTRTRRTHAKSLQEAAERVSAHTTPARRAYLNHVVAFLEGDNEEAGRTAVEWFESDRTDAGAAAAALVALGIGLERWSDAEKIADFALAQLPAGPALLNNISYVLAMSGRAEEAIKLLEPATKADTGFVLRATLGLCHLAAGDIDTGMRLYREAAVLAEKDDHHWCSLMTAYQAVVTRQLVLDKTAPARVLEASALIPQDLPDDWENWPDFLRLHHVCVKHGYDWPPHL
jgi:tetratricopeptide (TPR) repeat protein